MIHRNHNYIHNHDTHIYIVYMYINLKINKKTQEIFYGFILFIISLYITKYKEISYFVLFILLFLLSKVLFNKSFKGRYMPKTVIITISLLILIYGINYNNKYINNYLVAIMMFINIFILLQMCYPFKTIYDYLSLFGIILLLITFDFSKWTVKNMRLVNVDYNWIFLKTAVLTILYVFSTFIGFIHD